MILTILNFMDSKVYQKDMTEEPNWNEDWKHINYEEYLVEYGFSLKDIEWMARNADEGITPIENHG